MAFQPDPAVDGLWYPSAAQAFGPGLYSTDGLTESPEGSNLYRFSVGDYAYISYVPIPHTEMTIFDLDPAAVTITVYRTIGRRTMPVRGQINVYAVGGRNVVDWEAPFNVPITYRAEQFDITGASLGYTPQFTVELPFDGTIIQNVFDPVHGLAVTMAASAAASFKRPIPTELHYAVGSGLPIAVYGQRQGVTDVDISFFTRTIADADTVDGWFGDPYTTPTTPPVLCIRTGDPMRYPIPFYATVTDPTQIPLDLNAGGTLIRWDATATEVIPPVPALVGTVLSYNDIDASYPTYAAMDAAYSSYLSRDRDYSLAGAAENTPPVIDPTGPTFDGTGIYGAGTYGA